MDSKDLKAKSLLLASPGYLQWMAEELPPLDAHDVLVQTRTGAISLFILKAYGCASVDVIEPIQERHPLASRLGARRSSSFKTFLLPVRPTRLLLSVRAEMRHARCFKTRCSMMGVAHAVQRSQDGKGRAFDNIFTERLWRTVKYENIYLQDYQSLRAARQGIREYLTYYDQQRPHQSLGYQPGAEVYFGATGGVHAH